MTKLLQTVSEPELNVWQSTDLETQEKKGIISGVTFRIWVPEESPEWMRTKNQPDVNLANEDSQGAEACGDRLGELRMSSLEKERIQGDLRAPSRA